MMLTPPSQGLMGRDDKINRFLPLYVSVGDEAHP